MKRSKEKDVLSFSSAVSSVKLVFRLCPLFTADVGGDLTPVTCASRTVPALPECKKIKTLRGFFWVLIGRRVQTSGHIWIVRLESSVFDVFNVKGQEVALMVVLASLISFLVSEKRTDESFFQIGQIFTLLSFD